MVAAAKKKSTRARAKGKTSADIHAELQRIDEDDKERQAVRKWRDALSKRLPSKVPTSERQLRSALQELRKAASAAKQRIRELEAERERRIALLADEQEQRGEQEQRVALPSWLRGQSVYTITRDFAPRLEVARQVAALAGRSTADKPLSIEEMRSLLEVVKAEREVLTASEFQPRGWGLEGALYAVEAEKRGARRHASASAEKAWLLGQAGLSRAQIATEFFVDDAAMAEHKRARVKQLQRRHEASRVQRQAATGKLAARIRAAQRKRPDGQ